MEGTFYTSVYQGAYDENIYYAQILDETIKAAGGAKSEAAMLEAYASRT